MKKITRFFKGEPKSTESKEASASNKQTSSGKIDPKTTEIKDPKPRSGPNWNQLYANKNISAWYNEKSPIHPQLKELPHAGYFGQPSRNHPVSIYIVGGGLGDDADFLAKEGFHVVSADISEEAIKMAREKYPNSSAQFEVGNVLQPKDSLCGEMDRVLERRCFPFFSPDQQAAYFSGIAKLLKPGGKFVGFFYNKQTGNIKPIDINNLKDLYSKL